MQQKQRKHNNEISLLTQFVTIIKRHRWDKQLKKEIMFASKKISETTTDFHQGQ